MKKIWLVCSVALAVLVASPAQALDVQVQRQLKSADGTKLGCVLQVNDVSRRYHPRIRYLQVEAAIVCRKKVELHEVEVKFQPVAGSSRHLTQFSVWDDKSPFSRHFTARAQCNRIMPGNDHWNHAFGRVTLGTQALAGPFQAHVRTDLPWNC